MELYSALKTNRKGQPIKCSEFCCPEYSPDGHQIAYAVGNRIHFYDPINRCQIGKHLNQDCDDSCKLKYSHNGKMLAALTFREMSGDNQSYAGDHTIYLWDLISDKLLQILKGHDDLIQTMDFTRDGSQIISGDFYGMIIIWDVKSGMPKSKTQFEEEIQYLQYLDNDRQFLLNYQDQGIQIIHTDSKVLIKQLKYQMHRGNINVDGSQIISYSLEGSISIWNAKTGSHKKFLLRVSKTSAASAYMPCSKLIMVPGAYDCIMNVCCVRTKKIIQQVWTGEVQDLRFSRTVDFFQNTAMKNLKFNLFSDDYLILLIRWSIVVICMAFIQSEYQQKIDLKEPKGIKQLSMQIRYPLQVHKIPYKNSKFINLIKTQIVQEL